MEELIACVRAVPGVVGALICQQQGGIVSNGFPSEIDDEQVRQIAQTMLFTITGLQESGEPVAQLEYRFKQHLIMVRVFGDHLLLVMTEPSINRPVLERALNTVGATLEKTGIETEVDVSTTPASPSPTVHQGVERTTSGRTKIPLYALMVFCLLGIGGFGVSQYLSAATEQPESAAQIPVPAKTEAKAEDGADSAEIVLRLQGSNTIGARLAPALAKEFFLSKGAKAAPEIERINGSESMVSAQLSGSERKQLISIRAYGSNTAFSGLLKGTADVGMASRSIQSMEVEELIALGNLTSATAENVLAMDGLAIIVSPANHLQKLSREQIALLFSGAIKDWNQLPDSGLQGPIHIYSRNDDSGTFDTFESLILDPSSVKLSPAAKRCDDSNMLSRHVANDPQSIGFIGLPYIKPAKAIAVGDVGVQPTYPNRLTVATEDYPLSRRLFFYLPPSNHSEIAREFVEFSLSEAGQQVVKKFGLVELSIAEERVSDATRRKATEKYRLLTEFANRLSLDFRFRSGRGQLDSKGQRDLQRLVDYLQKDRSQRRGISLLGFADNLGGSEHNCMLSVQRAKVVEASLNSHGVYPLKVAGLCDQMPVASNESRSGREKNRRVEVWIER